MKTTGNFLKAALSGVALLALSGCQTLDPYAMNSCPTVGVLAEASEITRFRHGPGRAKADVEYFGEVTFVNFACHKPEGKDYIIGEAIVVMNFERGPAATNARQFFSLFSAMSEREEKIIDKSAYMLDVKFEDGESQVTMKKRIKGILVPAKGDLIPEEYNVYFGFQLTPGEVAYNRTKDQT